MCMLGAGPVPPRRMETDSEVDPEPCKLITCSVLGIAIHISLHFQTSAQLSVACSMVKRESSYMNCTMVNKIN